MLISRVLQLHMRSVGSSRFGGKFWFELISRDLSLNLLWRCSRYFDRVRGPIWAIHEPKDKNFIVRFGHVRSLTLCALFCVPVVTQYFPSWAFADAYSCERACHSTQISCFGSHGSHDGRTIVRPTRPCHVWNKSSRPPTAFSFAFAFTATFKTI